MERSASSRMFTRWGPGVLFALVAWGSLQHGGGNPGDAVARALTLTTAVVLVAVVALGARRVVLDGTSAVMASVGLAVALLQAACIVLCVLFLLDLSSNLTERAQVLLRRNPTVVLLLMASLTSLLVGAMPSRTLRRVLGNTTLALLSACVAIGVTEFTFRHWILVPRVPRTDNQFRRVVAATWPRPVVPEQSPARYRILGLADSFGQAEGPKNYHYVLTDSLNASSSSYEMVNFSVGEYEPADELAILTRFGPAYAPDLVLHGFCVGNDFNPASLPLLTFRDISVRACSGPSCVLPRNFTIRQWVRRYRMVCADHARKKRDATREMPTAAPSPRPEIPAVPPTDHPERRATLPDTTKGTFSREAFLRIVRDRMECCRMDAPRHPLFRVVGTLEELRTTVRKMNARYVMVVHPEQFQVEPALFRDVCEEFGLNPENYDLEKPQRLLTNYCRLRGITCIDLLPAFRASGADGGLYRSRDTHYSVNGNRVAAAEITKVLKELGIGSQGASASAW